MLFLTGKARNEHWENNPSSEKNLKPRVEAICAKYEQAPEIKTIDIPDGKQEEEYWTIFQRIYDTLEEGDSIIFDITHGLRSLPLLCFAAHIQVVSATM